VIEKFKNDGSDPWSMDHAAHLMRRAMIGVRIDEVEAAYADGLYMTVDQMLAPWNMSFQRIEKYRTGDVQAWVTPIDHPYWEVFFKDKDLRYTDTVQWLCQEVANAPASILPKLLMGWHSALPISLNGAQFTEHCLDYINILFENGSGDALKLLREVSTGVAMGIFLNGVDSFWNSGRDGVNENHARELLELHATGVYDLDGKANYTQADIKAMAYSMSGWKLNEWLRPNADGSTSLMRSRNLIFEKTWWDPRQKTIFGETSTWNRDDVLNLVFSKKKRNIAEKICRRLYREYVNDKEDVAFIKEMVQVLEQNNFQMKPVLKALFTSAHFFDAKNRMTMVVTPFEYMISIIRRYKVDYIPDFHDSDARAQDDLVLRLRNFEHCPFYPPHVAGWTNGMDWLDGSRMIMRAETGYAIALGNLKFRNYNGRPVYTYNPDEILESLGINNDALEYARRVGISYLGFSDKDPRNEAFVNECKTAIEKSPTIHSVRTIHSVLQTTVRVNLC